MLKATQKLISIASQPLGDMQNFNPDILQAYGALGAQLSELLYQNNGFYAFSSALHVFPNGDTQYGLNLTDWNVWDTWRGEYRHLAENKLFFAENAFGDQFCLHGREVCMFNSETGELTSMGSSLEAWAQRILEDYEYFSGYPLLAQWEAVNGPLPHDQRLAPITPFFAGGAFALENVYAISRVEALRYRGQMALSVEHMPDGTKFRIVVE